MGKPQMIRNMFKSQFTPFNIFAVFSAFLLSAVIIIFAINFDRHSLNEHRAEQRVTVINILSAIRAKLEGTVNGSMALLKGVASFISLNPNVTQDDFATFSSTLIQEHPQIRNIGAAPDLVIQLMYPIAGNEKAVGLDYRKTPLQWKAVERVVKTGVMALGGPIDLVQGGTGLIGRIPVYEGGNTGPFWGIVSGVIDMPSVYRIAGIFNPALALDLKIQGKDGLGSEGDFFYGQKTDLDNEAISLKVSVPNGEWVLFATPKGGWQTTHPDRQLYLFSTTTIVLMLNILTFMFIYFRSGRAKDRLFVRESEQQKRLILETVPDLIWLKGADGVYLACNPMFERFFGAAEADIIGKTDYDFVDEELADAFRKFDLITMEADQSSTNEEWITFSDDGHKVLLETIKTPFKGNNGEKLGILGIGRDITKRNIVEKALIDSEHWLAESQNVAHLGHYTLDTKTGLWKSSKALDDIFGIDENFTRDVEGWLNLIHPDFQEEMSIENAGAIIHH